MTTVAYKEGVMACDSCWSFNDAVDTLDTKIYRLPCGALLGQAGDNDCREIISLFEKVKYPSRLPSRTALAKTKEDFLGLLVFPNGKLYKVANNPKEDDDEDSGIWELKAPFAAIGSGSEFAVGAMAAGATAEQAVEIACKYDIASRPPIHVIPLEE